MNKDDTRERPDSPLKELKNLSIALLVILASLIITLIFIELALEWPSWVSNLLLALIAGIFSGALVSLLAWLFNKFAYEAINLRLAHRGVAIIINQSALFICTLSVWAHKQDMQDMQHELQKYLMAEKPCAAIDFCMQQIQYLKNIKITNRNVKGLAKHVQEHLDFLERTLSAYGSSFVHYGYCGYLLSQHSELHQILLVLKSTVIPAAARNRKKQDKTLTKTKVFMTEKALEAYFVVLAKFLKEARMELQKEQPAAQTP